jgi:hypothetical protein
MLIIEGPDGVGKTTFAHKCVKYAAGNAWQIPAVYSHFSRLPETWDYYHSYLPYMNKHSVMDRFHMSEVTYGHACRGNSRVDQSRCRLLDAQLDLLGSYTVILYAVTDPDMRDLYTIAADGRHEMFSMEKIVAVNQMYRDVIRGDGVSFGGESSGSWSPRYDLSIEVVQDEYPSDADVKRVVDAWCSRLVMTSLAIARDHDVIRVERRPYGQGPA